MERATLNVKENDIMEDIIIKIGEKEYIAHTEGDDYRKLIVNGKPMEVELLKRYHDNIFSFAVNQKLFQVELDFEDNNNLSITYDGFTYDVQITNSTQKLLEKFIKDAGGKKGSGAGIVKAPMPGMIVKNFVKEGDYVMQGDKLIIVEAMKMENVLKSTVSGEVMKVKAKEGTAVDKDAVLIEIKVADNA